MDPALDPYLSRVHQLAAPEGTQIESLGEELAVLRPADPGIRIVVARYLPGLEQELGARLRKIMRTAGSLRLEVVLVGGPDAARSLLKKAKPWVTGARQYLYHVSDRGELWCDAHGPSYPSLSSTPAPIDDASRAVLRAKADQGHETLSAERSELSAFAGRQRASRPTLTWAILAIIGAVFALEASFGGTESAPALIRMGALYPPRVRAGEIWRLASCTFLHSGPLHVLMNGYVLFALGAFLEKILGRWRFALLYAASALGGSLVSLYTMKQGFSVGASGALWGCLGAHAVLAFRSEGLLPRAMIPGARRAAVMNLFINVMISTRPNIDWAAHAGGGVVGAALLFLVLRRGLPKLGDEGARGTPAVDARPALIAPAAIVLSALLLGGLAVGIVRGRAWELSREPAFVARNVAEIGAEVRVPELLERAEPQTNGDGTTEVVFGEILVDPALVGLTRHPGDGGDVAGAQASIREALRKSVDAKAKLVVEPRDEVIGGRPAVRMRYRFPNSIEVEIVIVLAGEATYRVESVVMPEFPKWNDVAVRVAESIRPAGGS